MKPYVPPHILILLDRVAVLIALAGCLAWIWEYTVNQGWRNPMGRTLLSKTSLLTGLLALSAVSLLISLSRLWQEVFAWAGLAMLAMIGPVMAWRMIVFRRVSRATRMCPNGHAISLTAAFCPVCGAVAGRTAPTGKTEKS